MNWICKGCTAVYAVDAPQCPNCGSVEFRLPSDPEGALRVRSDDGPQLATPAGKGK